MAIHELISKYIELGWKIIPLDGKKPYWTGWNNLEKWIKGIYSNEKTIEELKRNPKLNIGVLTGVLSGIIAVDVDKPEIATYNPEPAIMQGALAHTTSNAPRLIFRSNNPEVLSFSRKVTVNINGKDEVVFEILGDGRQFVAPPSIHPEKHIEYEWITPLPLHMDEVMEIKDLNHLKAILLEVFQGNQLIFDLFPEFKPPKEISSELLSEWFNQLMEEKLKEYFARDCGNYLTFHCPFHPPDNNPSFAFYKNTFLFVDFHDYQVYTLKALAEKLGVKLESPRPWIDKW